MSRSLTIARVAGVPIRVHWSFSLLVLFVLFSAGADASAIETDALWIGILFASVTLHELSHSVVAMRLGLKVRDIVLLPIGGVSEIEGMDTSPSIESKVAIAGPLASIVLGVLFLLIALATGASLWPPALSVGSWLARIGWLNLALAAFNLLPALPMDGGRVFRSLMARHGNNLRATRIASVVAGAFGLAMIAYGFKEDYFLILIGAFVLMGATSEWQSAQLGAGLQGLRVGAYMHSDPTTVPAGVRAADVAAWLAHFPGRAVPVVDESGRYSGIVDQANVATAAPDAPVGSVTDREAPALGPEMDLFPAAVQAFQVSRRQQLAVVAGGRVIGVLYRAPVSAALARARQGGARVGWS